MNESDLEIFAKTSPAFRTRALGAATTMEVGYGAPRPIQSSSVSPGSMAAFGMPIGHYSGPLAIDPQQQQYFQQQQQQAQQQRNLQMQQYIMGALQQNHPQQNVRPSLLPPMGRTNSGGPQNMVPLSQGYPSMLQARSATAPSGSLYPQQPMFGYTDALQAAMRTAPPTPTGLWPSGLMPTEFSRAMSLPLAQQQPGAPQVQAKLVSAAAKPKRRSAVDASESGDESAGSASEGSESRTAKKDGPARKPKRARQTGDSDEANLNGEQRLMIVFDSFGRLSKHPQKMGRKQGFIPDGVSGTFSMYGEAWGFEVRHENVAKCDDGEERVCIRWTISNKVSGVTHSVVETPADAMKRDIRGVSLCNKVFVHAMELRAREYEVLVEKEKQSESPNMLKVSNYRSRAQCLRPQRFSEGPLLFGLRHKCVQDNMVME